MKIISSLNKMKFFFPMLTLGYLFTNYATLGVMPRVWAEINATLKGQGLYLFIIIYSCMGAAVLSYLLYIGYLRSIRNILYLVAFTFIFLLMFYLENNPGEKFHMLQYGIFGGLLYLSLYKSFHLTGGKLYRLGFIFSFSAGGLDEIIQGILPNRVFTWHDVFINGASSFLVIILLNILRIHKPKNLSSEISFLRIYDNYPYELLLQADPSRELISSYLENGLCYIARVDEIIVGVFILLETRKDTFEIMNISVHEKYQKKGIGKEIVLKAIIEAKERNAKFIEIGTSNSSLYQLKFYQSMGFNIYSIEKDFFIKNYKEPIYENEIQCKDKILLRLNLK